MSLRMQAMLLRFLENGEVMPVGADTPLRGVDVRVICATNRSLQDMVTKGTREDLFYRINVGQIEVPPLRDRREDIRPLVLNPVAGAFPPSPPTPWTRSRTTGGPANCRELHNVIEQMLALANGDVLGGELLPPNVTARVGKAPHPVRERRRRVAEIVDALTPGGCDFWNDVHPMFMNRDLTHDGQCGAESRKGLAVTKGNYRGLLQHVGLDDADYKRLLNFLAAHECGIDYREFRNIKHERGASIVVTRRDWSHCHRHAVEVTTPFCFASGTLMVSLTRVSAYVTPGSAATASILPVERRRRFDAPQRPVRQRLLPGTVAWRRRRLATAGWCRSWRRTGVVGGLRQVERPRPHPTVGFRLRGGPR